MTAPRFLWPVYGFTGDRRREPVASFFESADAEAFAMHPAEVGFEQRNLYIGEPRYDRRTSGYRPASSDPMIAYREWLVSLDTDPQSGRARVAA